ncbi:MAG: DUF1800 family protein [Acidobacteriota bacterium]
MRARPIQTDTAESFGPRLDRRDFFKWTGAAGLAAAAPAAAFGAPVGAPLTARQRAARFLAQCTFGGDLALIDQVAATGLEAWLDAQLALPPSLVLPQVEMAFEADPEYDDQFAYCDWAWWENALTAPDIVRHRLVYTLSQIFVISRNEETLFDSAFAVGAYHDVLARHVFGNFRDLLLAVALQPSMGVYLSHLNNRRSDPSINRFPDENFARELMQLFSIGLYLLNSDGTRKLDAQGQPIPTYGNAEITEMAKIFTGLTLVPEGDLPVEFGMRWDTLHVPMMMYEPEHEPGPKTLLGGFVVPDGQTGMQDITMAIDHLAQHPNVGPFIGTHFIKFLVTSNPSPAYVARVAAAFDDNGSGVRGDLKAVWKAVLLDPEARGEANLSDPHFGKVREPFVRWMQLGRAFHATSASGRFRHFGGAVPGDDEDTRETNFMAQYPFFSPSVFNFFSPTHQPAGALTQAGLVAPEMEIIHAYTSIAMINAMDRAVLEEEYISDLWDFPVWLDLDQEIELVETGGPVALVDHLELLLTHGTLSAGTRQIVINAILPIAEPFDQVTLAVYLMAISPEAAVQR